jgi:hypothetical protein
MSSPGLSLVGFITDQQQAFQHLRLQCVPFDPCDQALSAEWNAAQRKLGPPILRAGTPDIRPIPATDAGYIQQLMQQTWVQEAFRMFGYVSAEFKLVEIDPLLAYQFIVDTARSSHHCGILNNPTVGELMPICLPLAQPKPPDLSPVIDPPHAGQPQSIVIKVRNLSMQQLQLGIFGLNQNGYESWVAGMQIHVTLPFVHVVRLNGKYYLHNGFHRAFGARKVGVTHVPCLLRDVTTPQEAGIIDGQTFPPSVLTSPNPPTIGHFTQGRAHDVQLRALSRILHVSWSQSVMPDEYDRMNP